MTRRAAVQLFAYREPDLRPTLDAYAAAPTPDGWTFDYQGCVTSADLVTKNEVRAHPTWELHEVPPGKLNARNHAHSLAVRRDADVIVTADADEPPLNDDYFVNLLAPFDQEDVVGTVAFPKDVSLAAPLMDSVRHFDQTVRRPIRGNGSAFRTSAWTRAGPFRTDGVDQTTVGSIRKEEEYAFRRRLEEIGRVVDVDDARLQANNRRNVSRVLRSLRPVGRPAESYLDSRGTVTFAPLDDDG